MTGSDPTAGITPVAVPPMTATVFFQKKVMLALPWGKATHPLTAFSVAQLMDRRRTATALNFGDAFVAHSRNSIVDLFLKTESEYLFMVDDDMIIPFGHASWYREHTRWPNLPEKFAGLNALDRLLSHKKTLVGALYFGRYPDANPVYAEGPREKAHVLAKAPYEEVKPTKWVGTGCVLIHRSVFESIEKRFPRLGRGADGKGGQWFSSSEHSAMDLIDRARAMLGEGTMTAEKAMKAYQMLEEGASAARNRSTLGMGEDVSLCIRAQESGHQPFVDMGLLVGHIGHAVYPIR